MTQCCLVCNVWAGTTLRGATSVFGEFNTLQSGRKLSEVLSEIIKKPFHKDHVHSTIMCRKCFKSCSEYDSLQVRLNSIQSELTTQFKESVKSHNLNYESYGANSIKTEPPGPVKKQPTKKLVVPASKLQPIPPDFLLKVGKLGGFSASNLILPTKVQNTSSTINLKVTVGSSVLTQTVKTTTSKLTDKQTSVPSNLLSSLTDDIEKLIESTPIKTTSTIPSSSSTSYFSFETPLPKDFLNLPKDGDVKNEEQNDTENNDDHPMEIDEDCDLAVVQDSDPLNDSNLILELEEDKSKSKDSEHSDTQYIDLSELSPVNVEDGDQKKFILGKFQILNEDDDDDAQTIVVESEDGNILRMVSGQRLVYSDGNISLVMPDDDVTRDSNNEQGDSQDSNDESQIELQVSGDEETANAIIAAAQEQGGAFIKVESGEMYRVESVAAKPPSQHSLTAVAKDGDKFKCLLCERSKTEGESQFSGDAEAMMRHLKIKHDARMYICQLCGIVLRKRTDYTAHIAEHAQKAKASNRKVHKCTVCSRTYYSVTLLNEHMNTHSGARPHSCLRCHKNFASKYTLQTHLKTHWNRPRPFKCGQCGKSFLTQQNLTQHERTHSAVKDFICNICNKAFGTQHNLEVHGVVHSGKKPFVCGVCNKAFARGAEVRDHMRIHTGERPFACEVCGATFSQRSNLHSHKRATHLHDKRHACEHCPKRFKRRRLLEYHIKATHTGERPLKCEICKATFVYPEHYKKHIRIHSGERPYDCEICGKSFNSRNNRNTHRFVHSDKKPYECLACGAGYMRKQLLYAHMTSTGHIAESIVVNQPRITKVTDNGVTTQAVEVQGVETKTSKFIDAIFEPSEELDLVPSDNKSPEKQPSLQLIQETEEPTILAYNLPRGEAAETEATLLETVEASGLTDSTEIVASDENGSVMRLIQIQFSDGNNGWVAINK